LDNNKLLREAARDEKILISLENQLRIIQLEETKLEDPWELIIQPVLLNSPVAPSKRLFGLIGLFSKIRS